MPRWAADVHAWIYIEAEGEEEAIKKALDILTPMLDEQTDRHGGGGWELVNVEDVSPDAHA